MAQRIGELLRSRFELRRPVLSGTVTQVPLNAQGKSLGYIVVTVAGYSGERVRTGPNDVYYPGDHIIVEQVGPAGMASYRAIGLSAGPRPDSGMYEFSESVNIGNSGYNAGDLVWGSINGPNFYMDYNNGTIWLRTRNLINGALRSSGELVLGNPDSVHAEYKATAIDFMNGETVLSSWDASGRTIYGIEILGRPLGPGIRMQEIEDIVTGDTRYAFQILGLNGVPGISFLTGTVTNPDDYAVYWGEAGGANRLIWENGNLTVSGTITQNAGTTGGWTAGTTALTAGTGENIVGLDSGGINPAVYAGSSVPTTAPFRITNTGNLTATLGTVGGWIISNSEISSVNSYARLITSSSDAFGEGLTLLQNLWQQAGSVRWLDSDNNLGALITATKSGASISRLFQYVWSRSGTGGGVWSVNVGDGTFNTVTRYGTLQLQYDKFRVNINNDDQDFQVSGSADTNLIYGDASTDRVGIGTATPGAKLDVNGNLWCNGLLSTGEIWSSNLLNTDGNIQCAGTVSTNSGSTQWDFGTYSGSVVSTTGYVTVTINGSTIKLLSAS